MTPSRTIGDVIELHKAATPAAYAPPTYKSPLEFIPVLAEAIAKGPAGMESLRTALLTDRLVMDRLLDGYLLPLPTDAEMVSAMDLIASIVNDIRHGSPDLHLPLATVLEQARDVLTGQATTVGGDLERMRRSVALTYLIEDGVIEIQHFLTWLPDFEPAFLKLDARESYLLTAEWVERPASDQRQGNWLIIELGLMCGAFGWNRATSGAREKAAKALAQALKKDPLPWRREEREKRRLARRDRSTSEVDSESAPLDAPSTHRLASKRGGEEEKDGGSTTLHDGAQRRGARAAGAAPRSTGKSKPDGSAVARRGGAGRAAQKPRTR